VVTEVRVGVDSGAVRAGAAQIGHACEAFAQASGQIGGTPRATGPLDVGGLLDRVLEAAADALGKAARELDGIGGGLSVTAAAYESAERVLANWNVPGSSGAAR
jgi:hypothetical protein